MTEQLHFSFSISPSLQLYCTTYLGSLKRLWCWEGLKAGGERDDRGWNAWMASLTQWTWVWVNSGSWWWTGRPGVLQFMGSQRVGHDWVTELNWTELYWVALVVKKKKKKKPACQHRRPKRHGFGPWVRKILWVGKITWGGHDNTLHYSCLENHMNRGDWCATVHRVTKSQTWLKRLSTHSHNTTCLSSCQIVTLKIKTSNG